MAGFDKRHDVPKDEPDFLVYGDERLGGARTLLKGQVEAVLDIEDRTVYHDDLPEGVEADVEQFYIDRNLSPLDIEYSDDEDELEDVLDRVWGQLASGEVRKGSDYDGWSRPYSSEDDLR